MEQLQQIYGDYEAQVEQVYENASFGAGFFGMGDDPRKDVCHMLFYQRVEKWAAEFLESGASPEEAAAAAEFILTYPERQKGARTSWFARAAQKHALQLIPVLTAEDAGRLLDTFRGLYASHERMPVQNEVLQALEKRSGRPPEKKRFLFFR